MFIFWPVAVGLERLIGFYRGKNSIVHYGLVAFVPLLLVGMATGTYVRNIDWSSEKYLWEDAMRKAPRSSRPIQNLALTHYQFIGDHDTALVLYHKALGQQYYNTVQEGRIWNNIASIHHFRGDFRQAAQYWQKSVEKSPGSINLRYRLALTLTKLDRLDEALSQLDLILSRQARYVKGLNLKGIILWKQNRPREALLLFRKCIQLAPRDGRLLINIGASFHSLGDYRKAGLFFKEAHRRTARSWIALLWRVNNQLDAGDATSLEKDLEELLSKAPIDKLITWLHKGLTQKIYKDEILFPAQGGKLIESIKTQYLRKLERIGG
jgi:tetratricopeptide (TPR) repeat protein